MDYYLDCLWTLQEAPCEARYHDRDAPQPVESQYEKYTRSNFNNYREIIMIGDHMEENVFNEKEASAPNE